MCSLTLALTGLTTGLSMASQYQQSRAQAAAYEAQAQAAYDNAKIQNKKSEIQAEQYAQQQRDLDKRRRLIVGQQTAQAGASGIQGGIGSPLDMYAASMDAWNEDTQNALWNQRNNTYNSYVREVNYRNQGNAYSAQADAAKQAGTIGAIGNFIGGAATMFGMGGSGQKTLAGSASSAPGVVNTPTSAGYVAGAADSAFGNISGYTPQTMGAWQGYYNSFGPLQRTTTYTGFNGNFLGRRK